jgi:hypothetical protein
MRERALRAHPWERARQPKSKTWGDGAFLKDASGSFSEAFITHSGLTMVGPESKGVGGRRPLRIKGREWE